MWSSSSNSRSITVTLNTFWEIQSILNVDSIRIESTFNMWILYLHIECRFNLYWLHIDFVLNPHSKCTEYALNSYWIRIQNARNMHWIHIESAFKTYGICIEFIWNPHSKCINMSLGNRIIGWYFLKYETNRWYDVNS